MDPEVFADQNWQNELYNQKVRGFSTHTRLKINQKQGVFTPILSVDLITIQELVAGKHEKLSFLSSEEINKIIRVFDSKFIDESKKQRLNINETTVRIASSYSDDNRVYKSWDSTIHSDFGSVFFKKRDYNYGLLISNYEISDPRNKIGFRGIKIFKSGDAVYRDQQTVTINDSMYSLEEN